MPGAALRLQSVVRDLAGRNVLRGVSLEIPAGEWFALLGPSGSGKTTLLRVLAGLDRPDGGSALLDGREVSSILPRDRGVGFVFQDLALWPYLSVERHLREVNRQEADALLERFGLRGLESKRPHELSGGERQRLALARALARRPRGLLLDEPFSGLDPLLRRSLADLVWDLQREIGFTTVYVSHYFEAPVSRAARVGLLRDGRLEQVGTLAELRVNPANDWVAAFLADEAEVDQP